MDRKHMCQYNISFGTLIMFKVIQVQEKVLTFSKDMQFWFVWYYYA